MPGAHAILSASASKRWLSCPPSARLEEKLRDRFGDASSPFAEEGTKAHSLAELKLRRWLKEINDFSYTAQVKALGEIPPDMDAATDYYVDVVQEKYLLVKKRCPDAKLLLEHRLDFSKYVPKGFGTGDCLIVSDDILEVIDYKHGRGVRVEAENNPQARLYGLGALVEFGDLYGFPIVRNTIVQPRLDNVTEETLQRSELELWAEEIVRPGAELAWRGEGSFNPGDHCRFCKARAICYARACKAMSVLQSGFETPAVLPDAEIPRILECADVVEGWIKDVREYARQQAMRGMDYPGWKLVRGRRSPRHWVDEEQVRDQLLRAGYGADAIEKTSLIGVGEAEKLLGRSAFKALLGNLTTQSDGALTLVPEDDTRLAYNSINNHLDDL